MGNVILKVMAIASFLSFIGCSNPGDPSTWSSRKTDEWFEKGEWLNGWNIKPDSSINRREFAISYFKHKERWDKAFIFLKNSKLQEMEVKRYDIEGNDLYAPISEYVTKNPEDAKFEAHQKYIDIQYVIKGAEQIAVAPASQKKEILTPYDPQNDIEFMTVNQSVGLKATPDRFFIFFPSDLHRPGVRIGENSEVRKVVVKVKVD